MLPTGISERLITLRISIGETRCATIKILPTDNVITLGDFNARVGDGFANSNDEQLLSICIPFESAITNNFFQNA